jgi:hypothetical protein
MGSNLGDLLFLSCKISRILQAIMDLAVYKNNPVPINVLYYNYYKSPLKFIGE